MTELSKQILKKHQVRKTNIQKDEFIKLVRFYYPKMQIQQTGSRNTRNLIIGNLSKATTVISAHYDTGTNLFISNTWFPRNIVAYSLYQLIVAMPLIIAAIIGSIILWNIHIFAVAVYLYFILSIHFLSTSFGKANKNNVNCNTSGVITAFETLAQMSEEQRENTAIVLFDNKEKGLIGSSFFKQRYHEFMKDKILINLECVGEGDNIMVIQNKKAIEKYTNETMKAFKKTPDKTICIESANRVVVPSDQMGFPCYLSITAFKKSERLGLYLDNIRTKKDKNCDMRNIEYIANCILEFTNLIIEQKKSSKLKDKNK